MEEQDKWMKGLRSKLQNHSEPIPAGLWEQLEQELQVDTAGNSPKVIPMWRRWQAVAAVAAMFILSTTTLFFWEYTSEEALQQAHLTNEALLMNKFEEQNESNLMAVVEEVDDSVVSSTSPKLVNDVMVAASTHRVGLGATHTGGVTSRMAKGRNELASVDQDVLMLSAGVEPESDIYLEKNELTNSEDAIADENELNKMEQTKEVTTQQPASRKKDFFTTAVVQGRKKVEKKTMFALAMGNMPTSSSEAFGGYKRLQTDGLTGVAFNSPITDSGAGVLPNYKEGTKESALSAVVLDNIAKNEIYTDVKHHAPLTFGASVRFQLSKHWGVETGITYTLLESDLRGGSSDSYYEENQRLHYIGIPLRATRTIWSNRNFEVYASAGGAVEKSVSGRLKSAYTIDNREEVTHVESLNIKELQFSVAATVGAQYKVTQQMGFYLEPGMVYYFNDGSNVETIRKEHPYNFNLQLGFRVDF